MSRPKLLNDIDRAHAFLDEQGLIEPELKVSSLPTPFISVGGRQVLSFSSNNYLGLSNHPEVRKAALQALETYGYSTSESRRLGGNLELLEILETELAEFKSHPAAMITATGLLANVAAVHGIVDTPAMAHRWYDAPRPSRPSIILYDAFAHRSLRMGAKLSHATAEKFHHNDVAHLSSLLDRYRDFSALVVTDGVFSMDGDLAPLPELVEVCDYFGATLLVDDAHGSGVYGPRGRGTVEHFGLSGRVPIQVATLSKAFGAMGGVVLADATTVDSLKMFASGYRFTSSLPAEQAAGILASVRILKDDSVLRERLWSNTRLLREGLDRLGLTAPGDGPIVPLIVGPASVATHLESELLERGYWCAAVLPPLVKPQACRLRLTVSAMHSAVDIEGFLNTLSGVLAGLDLREFHEGAAP